MITLTFGLKKPETGDGGATVFPAMAANIVQLDAHDHDRADSAALAITAINVTTQTIASGSWVADVGGRFKQTITLPSALTSAPASFTLTSIAIQIRDGNGHVINPTIEKSSNTAYIIYTNDNSQTWTAVYTA